MLYPMYTKYHPQNLSTMESREAPGTARNRCAGRMKGMSRSSCLRPAGSCQPSTTTLCMMNPPDFCDICWKSVIPNQYGLLSAPVEQEDVLGPPTGGYVYKISGKAVRAGANQKCRWCTLLVEWGSSNFDLGTDEEAEIRVGKGSGSDGEHVFSIYVNDSICWFGYVYATEGRPSIIFY